MIGKIVLANIFFTDLSSSKVRPIFLFASYKDEDFLYLPLTTNLSLEGIKVTPHDLITGNLQKESIIIVPKIGIIHKSLFLSEIATVSTEVLQTVQKSICKSLGCEKI